MNHYEFLQRLERAGWTIAAPPDKYYYIVSGHDIIGACHGSKAMMDVILEEPGALFLEITEKEFKEYINR